MDEDQCFDILRQYVKEKLQAETEQVKTIATCSHADTVPYEDRYSCTQCHAVLLEDIVLCPGLETQQQACTYGALQRLRGVDRHFAHFIEKAGIADITQIHLVQEVLHGCKKSSRYASLNYAIILACFFWKNPSFPNSFEFSQKLYPFLPQSIQAWLRTAKLLDPLPIHFPLLFALHLQKHAKKLTALQLSYLVNHIQSLPTRERSLLEAMLVAYTHEPFYTCAYVHSNLCSLSVDIQFIVYTFCKHVLKP